MHTNCFLLDSEKPRPSLTAQMTSDAEARLGYKLPASYLDAIKDFNGGYLRRFVLELDREIEGQGNVVCMPHIMGIGYRGGIDGELGSNYLIKSWGYPDIGVVIHSEGHTAIMLDYSVCGVSGEPSVAFVDVGWPDGPRTTIIASNFQKFWQSLRESDDEVW